MAAFWLAPPDALSPGTSAPFLGFAGSGGPSYMSMSIHWKATESALGSTVTMGLRGQALALVAMGAMCSRSSAKVAGSALAPYALSRGFLSSATAASAAPGGDSRLSPAIDRSNPPGINKWPFPPKRQLVCCTLKWCGGT